MAFEPAFDPLSLAKTALSYDDEQDRRYFWSVINTFRSYRSYEQGAINSRLCSFRSMSEEQRNLLPDYEHRMLTLKRFVDHNQSVLDLAIHDCAHLFLNVDYSWEDMNGSTCTDEKPNDFNMTKLRTTLKQIVRDWSSLGEQERNACYAPICRGIEKYYENNEDRSDIAILVPGSGLGRLPFELACKGFSCQGNECSTFMLLTSNFIINGGHEIESLCIYPYLTQFCNLINASDQSKAVRFPDVLASNDRKNTKLSMVAGHFLDVYKDEGDWDCVATCFFIDTANNIIDYIQRIYKILKPGGLWINIGPLLYHFTDMQGEISVELTYNEVKKVMEQTGFSIQEENTNVPTQYLQQLGCMMTYVYNSIFFVAIKNEN